MGESIRIQAQAMAYRSKLENLIPGGFQVHICGSSAVDDHGCGGIVHVGIDLDITETNIPGEH